MYYRYYAASCTSYSSVELNCLLVSFIVCTYVSCYSLISSSSSSSSSSSCCFSSPTQILFVITYYTSYLIILSHFILFSLFTSFKIRTVFILFPSFPLHVSRTIPSLSFPLLHIIFLYRFLSNFIFFDRWAGRLSDQVSLPSQRIARHFVTFVRISNLSW